MKNYNQKGFIALITAIVILVVVLLITLSISILVLLEHKIIRDNINSTKGYYVAEAGVEDALLRVFDPSLDYSASYSFNVDEEMVFILIDKLSTSLTVESTGSFKSRIKKIETKAIEFSTEAKFYYGVQVGDGGLTMEGNSKIIGNVYSNGSIHGASNTGIYGDAYSAGPSGLIDSIKLYKSGSLDGNAYAHTISHSWIENDAYYQVIINTTVGGNEYPGSTDPEPENMPIPESDISEWKNDAASGGTIGNYSLGGNDEDSLGPIKIDGNFNISSNAILTVTGIIWVTGDVDVDSNAVIKLDSSFGLNSSLIIVDGKINLSSNIAICGSEGHNAGKCNDNEGSFLMLFSTNPSLDKGAPAINSSSNSQAAVLYANNGIIVLDSNADLKEVTGCAVHLNSNAIITYDSGLASAKFTSGPYGGWNIISWKEIE